MKELRKYVLGLLLLVGSSIPAMAADTDNPDDPTSTDPGQAPIGDYVPLMLTGGIVLGYLFLQKKKSV
ncbi:hypothetical protein [Flavobacterium croceum]|jgi:hypothetical protein|uniref:Secreted protein with PEP-CTERM sorting signal n=1 Tax=Flavobacterium croceum DSM 17960 TaxID=1121886 RepID=A0A2S4N6E6_9FLAO|nr:hypothetical protein [Flavobacterium croceum]POS00883.1 hypothetical protein Q361_11816 [Flavobacterium croceum DSM 17960]